MDFLFFVFSLPSSPTPHLFSSLGAIVILFVCFETVDHIASMTLLNDHDTFWGFFASMLTCMYSVQIVHIVFQHTQPQLHQFPFDCFIGCNAKYVH